LSDSLGSALAPRTNADTWDRLTKVTFSGPVEIPGQVLPAGTYWLKLLDSPSNRNIAQISNEDRNKVHAYGQEFVYPKVRAVRLAGVAHQPVPSMPSNLEAATKIPPKSANDPPVVALKRAPVKAEQPTGEEVETTEIFPTPPQLLAQNSQPAKSDSPAQPASKLPATASELPLVGLLGLVLASAGVLLRFAARRFN